MHVTGADVISVKGASLVFLTGERWHGPRTITVRAAGWWICCLIVFVISTSGWDLIGMVAYLQTARLVWMNRFRPACVNVCVIARTLQPNWLLNSWVRGSFNLSFFAFCFFWCINIRIFGKLQVMFSVTRKCCSPYGGILPQIKSVEKHGEKRKMSCWL